MFEKTVGIPLIYQQRLKMPIALVWRQVVQAVSNAVWRQC